MTRGEKIVIALAFIGISLLVLFELYRQHQYSILKAANTNSSNAALPLGQLAGPPTGQDLLSQGFGPWFLYYNTPGAYYTLPPVANFGPVSPTPVSTPSSSGNASTGNCSTCH